MESISKINAIMEIHEFMRPVKSKTRILAISGVALISAMVILTSAGDFNQIAVQASLFLAIGLIFVFVFAGRVALGLARRHFRNQAVHEYILMYSEAEDLRDDADKVSKMIERRRIERENRRF